MTRRIVIAAAVLTACRGGGSVLDRQPFPAAWTADIAALGEHGQSGFATVSVLPEGGTRANVTLSGGSAGGNHPWVLQEGTCESDGPVIGDAEAYPILRPNERGNASGTTTLDLSLSADKQYALRIYQSPEDRETLVGCGNLQSNR